MNKTTQTETTTSNKADEAKAESKSAYADFIDEKQLLTRLPVSRRTLWQWRETGKIPCVRVPGGRRVLFHWPSVEAALLRRQKGGAQ